MYMIGASHRCNVMSAVDPPVVAAPQQPTGMDAISAIMSGTKMAQQSKAVAAAEMARRLNQRLGIRNTGLKPGEVPPGQAEVRVVVG